MLESGIFTVWRFDVENDDDVHYAVVADIVDEMEVTTETPAQEAEENEAEVNQVTASAPYAYALVCYVPSNSGIGFFM